MPQFFRRQTILFLSANSVDGVSLGIDQEMRDIEAGLERSRHRGMFELKKRTAVRPIDLRRALQDLSPRFVHFSGHGTATNELILENVAGRPCAVSRDALAGLFELFSDVVECVVLNACYSHDQAEAISAHIQFVIGMQGRTLDEASIAFSVGYYDSLAAGEPIERAFRIACNAIDLEGFSGFSQPCLLRSSKQRSVRQLRGLMETDNTSLPSLAGRSSVALEEMRSAYEARIEEWPSDAEALFNLGLVYLHLKEFSLAGERFKAALRLAPACADCHYYLALSLLRGRRASTLMIQEVRELERHVEAAINLEETSAKYDFFLGFLRYDYYRRNGLRVPGSSVGECLSQGSAKRKELGELARLSSLVPGFSEFLSGALESA